MKIRKVQEMAHHGKAAVAACFATLCIIAGTVSLAQSGGQGPGALFAANAPIVR